MNDSLRLMCVLAHPDDESLGTGGTLAKYAAEGVETFLVTATRGERGRFGDADPHPGIEVVGPAREMELRAAAQELGVKELHFLDYIDKDLDQADPEEAITKISRHLRRIRPHVVITFAPDGAYGHPDHIAISQFTTAACVCAADPTFDEAAVPVHRVSKLYFMAWPQNKWEAYQTAFKDLVSKVDGVERRATPWPDWAITTVIDTSDHWETVWKAVQCHETQIKIFERLQRLPENEHAKLWGTAEYYRAFSTVNGGRKRETDLFEGLRSSD